jgi:acyl-CoA-binding protein
MSDLEKEFNRAAEDVKTLKEKPGDDVMLELYALYKQVTVGDVTGDRPGPFDFVGRAKYDAWARQKGTSRQKAMQEYIALVKGLL